MPTYSFNAKKCLLFFILFTSLSSINLHAQITTSGIRGKVVTATKSALSAAAITAILETTNEKYITTSQSNGSFNLPNIKSGGPYTVICSYIGFKADTITNIYLSLGNFYYLDFELQNKVNWQRKKIAN